MVIIGLYSGFTLSELVQMKKWLFWQTHYQVLEDLLICRVPCISCFGDVKPTDLECQHFVIPSFYGVPISLLWWRYYNVAPSEPKASALATEVACGVRHKHGVLFAPKWWGWYHHAQFHTHRPLPAMPHPAPLNSRSEVCLSHPLPPIHPAAGRRRVSAPHPAALIHRSM